MRVQKDPLGVCPKTPSKRKYLSKKRAKEAAKMSDRPFRVYECPYCAHWHLATYHRHMRRRAAGRQEAMKDV